MTLMGGAAASEILIGGYIWTIGGCSTHQKQPRENAEMWVGVWVILDEMCVCVCGSFQTRCVCVCGSF